MACAAGANDWRPPLSGLSVDLEIEIGKVEIRADVERRAVGEVIGDMLGFAKEALAEEDEGRKNVAAVLTAAAFEDVVRKVATALAGVQGKPKLSEVLESLKQAKVLVGAPFTTAQSFLKFRNDALHADRANIDQAVVRSCLVFTEQLVHQYLS